MHVLHLCTSRLATDFDKKSSALVRNLPKRSKVKTREGNIAKFQQLLWLICRQDNPEVQELVLGHSSYY